MMRYHHPDLPTSCRRRMLTPSPGRNSPSERMYDRIGIVRPTINSITDKIILRMRTTKTNIQYSFLLARPLKSAYLSRTHIINHLVNSLFIRDSFFYKLMLSEWPTSKPSSRSSIFNSYLASSRYEFKSIRAFSLDSALFRSLLLRSFMTLQV